MLLAGDPASLTTSVPCRERDEMQVAKPTVWKEVPSGVEGGETQSIVEKGFN